MAALDVLADECDSNVWRWSTVVCPKDGPKAPPCSRSLHVASVYKDKLLVFGGYDGSYRVNDFYEFCFKKHEWRVVPPTGQVPPPRDRHVSVVFGDSFYVFGGFDGVTRVNDFYEYNFVRESWAPVAVGAGSGPPPSPRHSHGAVIYGHSMFCFGGYDGSYRSDFHAFSFATNTWSQVMSTSGRSPRARYRSTCVVHGRSMILFGGHDGNRHLNDCHIFGFEERAWSVLATEGQAPIPRDSHVAVTHGNSMFVFGGSTGSAMNDFHELRLDVKKWQPVHALGASPGPRFCHVAAIHDDSMVVFGGYDGSNRLNDFVEFHLGPDLTYNLDIPPSTLVADLRSMALDTGDNNNMSDVTFVVEGVSVRAHKVLCMRCSYFRALLTGPMQEAYSGGPIELPHLRHAIFMVLLEYLYTDAVEVPLDQAMELFQAADRFGVERLKRICEAKMLGSICVDNAASIFHAADQHNAVSLREKTLGFILANFDPVTKTACFEEMGRTNVELVFEILKSR